MWCTGSSSTAVTPSSHRCAIAGVGGEPGVRAAQILADVRMAHRVNPFTCVS